VNDDLLKAESEIGICKVICFSPDHSKSLAGKEVEDIKKVVHA
jgi:UDPglucose--hexose-1-phosphate uridylyltransferase